MLDGWPIDDKYSNIRTNKMRQTISIVSKAKKQTEQKTLANPSPNTRQQSHEQNALIIPKNPPAASAPGTEPTTPVAPLRVPAISEHQFRTFLPSLHFDMHEAYQRSLLDPPQSDQWR